MLSANSMPPCPDHQARCSDLRRTRRATRPPHSRRRLIRRRLQGQVETLLDPCILQLNR